MPHVAMPGSLYLSREAQLAFLSHFWSLAKKGHLDHNVVWEVFDNQQKLVTLLNHEKIVPFDIHDLLNLFAPLKFSFQFITLHFTKTGNPKVSAYYGD